MQYKIAYKHLEKILYPKDKITKQAVLEYYQENAKLIFSYWQNRPLTIVRFPDGINEEGFFQKNACAYFPKWLDTKSSLKKNGTALNLIIFKKKATLYYLVNLGTLCFHLWLSKADKLNLPDRIIFDLDPSTSDFQQVAQAAQKLKKIICELNLAPFIMTTGSRGLHIVIPILREKDFSFTHEISKQIASIAVKKHPELFTLTLSKKERKKKIFIDYIRNSFGQTSIAPYSLRSLDGAPVATPLYWEELENKKLTSQTFNIHNIFKKLEKDNDPWKTLSKKSKSLVNIFKNLQSEK
jgi:bifunctional non-homologous end joining protein LigD